MEASVCTRTRDQTPQTPSSRLDFSPAQAPRADTVGDTDALLSPDRDTPRRSRHKPAEDGEASPRTSRPAPRRALILGPGALAGSRIPAPPRGRTGPTASTPLPAQPSAGSPEHVLGAPDLHRRGRRPWSSGSALCGLLRRVVGAGRPLPRLLRHVLRTAAAKNREVGGERVVPGAAPSPQGRARVRSHKRPLWGFFEAIPSPAPVLPCPVLSDHTRTSWAN